MDKQNLVSKMYIFDPELTLIEVRIFTNGRTSTVRVYSMLECFSNGYVLTSNLVVLCL